MKMDTLLTCSANGWAMIAGTALIYGVLGLTGAALIKYLLSDGSTAAHSSPSVLLRGDALMETVNVQMTTPAAGGSFWHSTGQASPGWLIVRLRSVVGEAATAAATALATTQNWLPITDLQSVLA